MPARTERQSKPRPTKLLRPRHKRAVAGWMTWILAGLQAAMLVTLAVSPGADPPRGRFFEMLWAWMHKPTFYPFIVLLIAGPVLTFLAAQVRGLHRWWLFACWSAFFILVASFFGDRVLLMGRVLWWRYVE